MQLFKVQTIPQFKIQSFLIKEGLQPEAVAAFDFPSRNSVRITDVQGSTMTVTYSEPGKYDFLYLIRGVTSQETRYDEWETPNESR